MDRSLSVITSKVILKKKNGIEHRRTTPLWPQANGEIDRQNRTILNAYVLLKQRVVIGDRKWMIS